MIFIQTEPLFTEDDKHSYHISPGDNLLVVDKDTGYAHVEELDYKNLPEPVVALATEYQLPITYRALASVWHLL